MAQGIKKANFLKSAFKVDEYPPPGPPEVAITGRSNSGKSTLINAMTGRKIAKVSQKAGKTDVLNFFDIDDGVYRLVDMPGYGFASRGARQIQAWKKMIENYLSVRESIRMVLITMDIRRDWSEDEESLCRWLTQIGHPVAVILTKADKLSFSQKKKRIADIVRQSGREIILSTSVKDPQTYLAVDKMIRQMTGE